MPLFRGAGPTWIPRPVKLTHVLSKPIDPWEGELRNRARPAGAASPTAAVPDDELDQFHARVVGEMNALMRDSL